MSRRWRPTSPTWCAAAAPQPEALAEVIARSYGYRGDSETYDDLQNADLVRVIERRKGLPVALSILYLARRPRARAGRPRAWPFPAIS